MTSVGVGWVEGNEDLLADMMRQEGLNVASGLKGVPCTMLRSDKTAPAISRDDFRAPSGGGAALADEVDLLVLAGHGSGGGGLKLNNGTALRHNSVVFGGKLRCVVMVSCAILEADDLLDPRAWTRVFDGLHRLIAPSTFVAPRPGRGERFARYLNEGLPFVDAWELACAESSSDLSQWSSLVLDEAFAPGAAAETLQAPLVAPTPSTSNIVLEGLSLLP